MTSTDAEHHELFTYVNIYIYLKTPSFFSFAKDWTKAASHITVQASILANSNLQDLLE